MTLRLSDIVGKSKASIAKINKEDLVKLLNNNDTALDDPTDLADIRESLAEIKENIINVILDDNKKLKAKLKEVEERNAELLDEMDDLRYEVVSLDRYSRRNNIEIGGIPENIQDLEETVVAVLNHLEVNCSSADIQGCHRLSLNSNEKKSGYPKRTIVRFVNRKIGEKALANRKRLKDADLSKINYKLKNTKLFIAENLCPYDVALLSTCKQLYTKQKINSCWAWKGSIFFKIGKDDVPIKFNDFDDLYSMFEDFDFY